MEKWEYEITSKGKNMKKSFLENGIPKDHDYACTKTIDGKTYGSVSMLTESGREEGLFELDTDELIKVNVYNKENEIIEEITEMPKQEKDTRTRLSDEKYFKLQEETPNGKYEYVMGKL